MEEMECPKDLATLVRDYLPGLSLSSRQISGIVNFYLTIKSDQSEKLMDGTGHKPHFRYISRTLSFQIGCPQLIHNMDISALREKFLQNLFCFVYYHFL